MNDLDLGWLKRHDLNRDENEEWVLAVAKSMGWNEKTCHISYFESEKCLCLHHNVSIYYVVLDWDNQCLRIVEELNFKKKLRYHKLPATFTGETAYYKVLKYVKNMRIRF